MDPMVDHSIAAISGPSNDSFTGKCFICDKEGHRQADCHFLKKAKNLAREAENNRGGRNNGRVRKRRSPKKGEQQHQGN